MSKLHKSIATFFLLIFLTLSASAADGWMSTAGWMSTGIAPSPSPTPAPSSTTDGAVDAAETPNEPEATPDPTWEMAAALVRSAFSLF